MLPMKKIISKLKKFFTSRKDLNQLMSVSPYLFMVLGDVAIYCHENKLPLDVTSIIRKHNDGLSKSKTHQTGRAIDISIKGWDTSEIDEVVHTFNNKYAEIAAISASDNIPRLMIAHEVGKNGMHIHIQVRSNIKKFFKE